MDLSDPRAVPVMQSVRQMVASLADPATALRRARDAARASLERIGSDSMGSDFGCTGEGVRALERLPRDRPVWIVGDVRGDAVALASVLAFIDASDAGDRKAAMVFLGDWTGGTAGDAACTTVVAIDSASAARSCGSSARASRAFASVNALTGMSTAVSGATTPGV